MLYPQLSVPTVKVSQMCISSSDLDPEIQVMADKRTIPKQTSPIVVCWFKGLLRAALDVSILSDTIIEETYSPSPIIP